MAIYLLRNDTYVNTEGGMVLFRAGRIIDEALLTFPLARFVAAGGSLTLVGDPENDQTGASLRKLATRGGSSTLDPNAPPWITDSNEGSWQVRPTIVDRDAIPSADRLEGMHVYVVATDTVYRLGPGLTNADWIPVPTGGAPVSANVPQPVGITGVVGIDLYPSRSDHVHALPFTPVQNALANATGSISVNTQLIRDVVDPVLPQDAATKDYVDNSSASGVPATRNLIAGAGLTGGGTLASDRTFNVGANPDGSIVVNANDVQVGILATDAQHGARGGGTQHALVIPSGAAGFISGADKAKLDGIASGATATPLTAVAPVNVTKAAAAVGVSTSAARADHKHDITTAVVSTIGVANAEGAASSIARSDHVHDHGAQTVGTHHALVIPASTPGFMSGADKTKLDGIASGATATPLSVVAPVDVTKSAALVGVSTSAARSDHKHDIATAVVSNVGIANAEGVAASIARSDHIHDAPAATSVNKFMMASVTLLDNAVATVTAVIAPPALMPYISVYVNGVKVRVGDGTKIGMPCYFSGDGGITARVITSVVAGDFLYWNGSVALYQLDAGDRIDFDFESF